MGSALGARSPLIGPDLDREELDAFLQGKKEEPFALIDSRFEWEAEEHGKIAPSAINIPYDKTTEAFSLSPEEFLKKFGVAKPPNDQIHIFYCKKRGRADKAAKAAAAMGIKGRVYRDGFTGYTNKDYSMNRPTST